MKHKDTWITVAVVNLCIVAFLGMVLRTKFLFPLPFVDYKNLLNAHSHYAFGGWVALILLFLMIEELLLPAQKTKKVYQVLLGGIQVCSLGMLLTFPFQGYGLYSIIFSTLFILVTYVFSWVFISDLRCAGVDKPVLLLAVFSLLCLVLSSAGPFYMAYIIATHGGSAGGVRDAVCFYLHFQYNGFFIPAVFALFFRKRLSQVSIGGQKKAYWFSMVLAASIPFSLFLSLLWRLGNPVVHGLALTGAAMTLLALGLFFLLFNRQYKLFTDRKTLAGRLLIFSMAAFAIKMILQVCTVVPGMADAIFGHRPIIIGFLHLVFLGMVTLYVFSHLIERGLLHGDRTPAFPVAFFAAAVIMNELVLFVNGLTALLGAASGLYAWLLWIASILLFTGALLITVTGVLKKFRRLFVVRNEQWHF